MGTTTGSQPQDWTPDGQLLIQRWDCATNGDFWLVALASSKAPVRLPSLDSNEGAGQISSDGRWLAYEADEIYVRPLESLTRRWQISHNGGHEPRWREDGKELFHLSNELAMMTSEIQPGPVFHSLPARTLFQTRAVAPTGLTGQAYDVTSDGQRFLIKVAATPSPITVVVNWLAMVQSRPGR